MKKKAVKKQKVEPIVVTQSANYEQLNKMLLVANLIATFALSALAYMLLRNRKPEVVEVPVLTKEVPVPIQVPIVLQESTGFNQEIKVKGFGFGGPTGQA
jgi:hypothetical protein